MTEVNKNIIDAYKSMYEPKEEVLDETNKNDKSDDGDGLDAVQPKAVKKKFDDRKDKDIDNDGDVDKTDKYLLKRRKAIGKAIRMRAEAYLADGTISTEAKGKEKITGKNVDNYASGAVTMNPEQEKDEKKKKGANKSMQYAHLELRGSTLSEAQMKMLKMYSDKKKKEEKKDKISDMMTKTSVKKEDEKEEEKPDMRSKYTMINLIKNKLRAAGQRDPMVAMMDMDEHHQKDADGNVIPHEKEEK